MNSAVFAILALEWDPLGTVARGGFENEYEVYGLMVVSMLVADATASELTSFLCHVELVSMIQVPDLARAQRVSDRLVAMWHENQPN